MRPENLQIQIQAMAAMVEIEAMKTENERRSIDGVSHAYDETEFWSRAEHLQSLSESINFQQQEQS